VYLHKHNFDDRQAEYENKAIVQRLVLCKQYLYIHKISIADTGKSVHMHPVVSYTNTKEPITEPNTKSAASAIGARSSGRELDLKPGLGLLEAVDEPVGVGVNVALGMSDDGTAEMDAGDCPP
jgi:hypothetical protein